MCDWYSYWLLSVCTSLHLQWWTTLQVEYSKREAVSFHMIAVIQMRLIAPLSGYRYMCIFPKLSACWIYRYIHVLYIKMFGRLYIYMALHIFCIMFYLFVIATFFPFKKWRFLYVACNITSPYTGNSVFFPYLDSSSNHTCCTFLERLWNSLLINSTISAWMSVTNFEGATLLTYEMCHEFDKNHTCYSIW